MKILMTLIFAILVTLVNVTCVQVPHGNITIEVPISGEFEVFPDFGSVNYIVKKELYTFEHNTDKSLIKVDTIVDSLNYVSIMHTDGWVNFDYQKNKLYSSLIIQGEDSMLVYVFTGTGRSRVDKLLTKNGVELLNILFENLIFKGGTALINIYDQGLKTLEQVYTDNQLPVDDTLVIQGELIIANMISDQVLTTVKLENVLADTDNSLPKEYRLILDCFEP